MKKRYLVLIVGIVMVAVGVYLQLSYKKITKVEPISEVSSSGFDKKEEFIEPDKLIKKVEKFEKSIENLEVENDLIDEEKSSEVFSPFTTIDIDEVDSLKKSDITPVSAISVESGSISKANIADVIELPTIGSSNYQIKVTDKKINKSGSITISGNLVEDEKYSAVLTESKKGLYGSITTPDGAYEIEVQDGKGYVYSVSDIEDKRVDYSQTDEIEIPHHE